MWKIFLIVLLASTEIYTASIDPICMKPLTSDYDPEICCQGYGINVHILTTFRETLRCFDIYFEPDNPEPHYSNPAFQCLEECLLNDTNVIQNKVFQKDAAIRMFTKIFEGTEVSVPVLKQGIEMCEPIIKKMYSLESTKDKCSDFPMFFLGCMQTHIFKNCPAETWQIYSPKNLECNKIREDTKSCPVMYSLIN